LAYSSSHVKETRTPSGRDADASSPSPGNEREDSTAGDVFRILLSIILPPVGVFLEVGFTKHFWINILLTLLGYIPGVIHAVYIVVSR
jgi:uncharacterized membrane protein YqaE (UPF0057 family)